MGWELMVVPILILGCLIIVQAAITRGLSERLAKEVAARKGLLPAAWTNLRDRLQAVEQWERWIVKLQKQLQVVQKQADGAARAEWYNKLWPRVRDLEMASERMAQVVKHIVPLASAVKAGTDLAEKKMREDPGLKTWEDLTARPVAPFGTGVTCASM